MTATTFTFTQTRTVEVKETLTLTLSDNDMAEVLHEAHSIGHTDLQGSAGVLNYLVKRTLERNAEDTGYDSGYVLDEYATHVSTDSEVEKSRTVDAVACAPAPEGSSTQEACKRMHFVEEIGLTIERTYSGDVPLSTIREAREQHDESLIQEELIAAPCRDKTTHVFHSDALRITDAHGSIVNV